VQGRTATPAVATNLARPRDAQLRSGPASGFALSVTAVFTCSAAPTRPPRQRDLYTNAVIDTSKGRHRRGQAPIHDSLPVVTVGCGRAHNDTDPSAEPPSCPNDGYVPAINCYAIGATVHPHITTMPVPKRRSSCHHEQREPNVSLASLREYQWYKNGAAIKARRTPRTPSSRPPAMTARSSTAK